MFVVWCFGGIFGSDGVIVWCDFIDVLVFMDWVCLWLVGFYEFEFFVVEWVVVFVWLDVG